MIAPGCSDAGDPEGRKCAGGDWQSGLSPQKTTYKPSSEGGSKSRSTPKYLDKKSEHQLYVGIASTHTVLRHHQGDVMATLLQRHARDAPKRKSQRCHSATQN